MLLAAAARQLALSGRRPRDRFTWLLEVAPVLAAAPLLVATHRRFPLTPLARRLIFLHAAILMLGGRYTYAEVPLGHWDNPQSDDALRDKFLRLAGAALGATRAAKVADLVARVDKPGALTRLFALLRPA